MLFVSKVLSLQSGHNNIKPHPKGICSHALLTWTQTAACSAHLLVLLPPHGPTSE